MKILLSVLVMTAFYAHAETWNCQSTTKEQVSLTAQVVDDGHATATLSGIFGFSNVDVEGNLTEMNGEVRNYDSYEATVSLERNYDNLQAGWAHGTVDINIDCLGPAHYDLAMKCQISK
jgi:hypothetical protein